MRRKPDNRSFVYVMLAPYENEVKIGYSCNPVRRLSSLESSRHVQLEMVVQVYGDRKLEARLHKQFAPYRIHGEWFVACPEIIEWTQRHRIAALHDLALAIEKRRSRLVKIAKQQPRLTASATMPHPMHDALALRLVVDESAA